MNDRSKQHTCPACGFLTRENPEYGSYDMCDICDWEDDPLQLVEPTYAGGANTPSLFDWQQNIIENQLLTQQNKNK